MRTATHTWQKARDLLFDPHATMTDLRRVIVKDRTLADRLITRVKACGFPPESWNVNSAVILLEFQDIREILSEPFHA